MKKTNLQLMIGKNLSKHNNFTSVVEIGAIFVHPFSHDKEVYPNIRFGAVYTFDKDAFSTVGDDTIIQTDVQDLQIVSEKNISRVFARLNFGIADLLSFNLGYNFDKRNSLALLLGGAWLQGGYIFPNSGIGVGAKYTYSFNSKLFIKNISVSSLVFTETSEAENESHFFKGGLVELTFGNQKDFENGFSFVYEFGVMSTKSIQSKILVMPSLKIGTNFNF